MTEDKRPRSADPELCKDFLRSILLRRLLRASLAHPRLFAVHIGGAGESAIVRRPVDIQNRVGNGLSAPGKRLLKLGLVIDMSRERVLDPAPERVSDRLLDFFEAELAEEGGKRGLEQRREHVAFRQPPLQ